MRDPPRQPLGLSRSCNPWMMGDFSSRPPLRGAATNSAHRTLPVASELALLSRTPRDERLTMATAERHSFCREGLVLSGHDSLSQIVIVPMRQAHLTVPYQS